MKKFEYYTRDIVEHYSYFGSEKELNFLSELGKDGWILTNILRNTILPSDGHTYYFYRDIEVKTKPNYSTLK